MRERLERIVGVFSGGYAAALDDPEPTVLAAVLEDVDDEWRGWAYEGAAMALGLLDLALPPLRGGRFAALLAGPGRDHPYMMHVGLGWALTRVPRRPAPVLERCDPLLRWLAVDGMGFHDAYFRTERTVAAGARRRGLGGYATRAYDQGVGRCLWFVAAANPERIAARIARLDAARHDDLWSGVGLAAAYAGGLERDDLERLVALAGSMRGALAQGAAFAAKARQRAGIQAVHTEIACAVLCACTATTASAATDDALPETPAAGDDGSAYEQWRRDIRGRLAATEAAA